MSNQRSTFMKRQREMDLKDKARAKEARRAAKRDETPRTAKGPEIAWGDAVTFPPGQGPPRPPTPPRPGSTGAEDDADTDPAPAGPTERAGNAGSPTPG